MKKDDRIKSAIKRSKLVTIGFALFLNLLFIYGYGQSNDLSLTFFLVVLGCLNFFSLILYKSNDWLAKKGEQYILDGDLQLMDQGKKSGIIKCLKCNKHTISSGHAMKSIQTCGECGAEQILPINKKVIHTNLAVLLVLTILAVYGVYTNRITVVFARNF